MKNDSALIEEVLIYNLKETTPRSSRYGWISTKDDSSVKVYVSYHQIAGSATDQSISLDEDANTKLTLLADADNGSTLKVKIDGSSTAQAVKARRIRSGKLTSLTVTNSDSAAKRLIIARVVTSGSNISLVQDS